jgi:hypothetical protein
MSLEFVQEAIGRDMNGTCLARQDDMSARGLSSRPWLLQEALLKQATVAL